MGAYESASAIINQAALELGIGTPNTPSPAGADPWASTDQNILKLIGYLNSGCRDLVRKRAWTSLVKEYSFVTVAGVDTYNPPADFRNVSDRTGWDRTNRFPLGGPLDGVEWQYLKGILAGNPLMLYFRVKGNQFVLAGGVNVPGGRTVAYEYNSSFWAGVAGSGLPAGNTLDAVVAKDNLIFLETNLVSRRLMHDFASKNGMGDIFEEDYLAALEKAENDDANPPTLSLAPRRRNDLISPRNLPPTGWGT